ncbi:Hpt domain-containing protein [Pygmaiobacter massiliensis]|uniref:Hpt domain-containing protein n=1 Tax=Pygmaiobacter massiliensis TaxID=1917873 RepID=UPI002A823E32|nr:Hpt domain-containing protein [Pygmaiobacter massiliensis]MDY4784853.1 Hpt domain-containing protein [Pygmaiobacter massiliensis]
MEKLLDELQAWGCDIPAAIDRVLGDKELYCSCLELFAEDENFELCAKALHEQNYRAAFEAAHALKGVAANLELTPLRTCISALVEQLRHKQTDGLEPYWTAIQAARTQLQNFLKERL